VVYGDSGTTRAAAGLVVDALAPETAVLPVESAAAATSGDLDTGLPGLVARRPDLVVAIGRLDTAAVTLGVRTDAPVIVIPSPTTEIRLRELWNLCAEPLHLTVLDVAVDGLRRLTLDTVTVGTAKAVRARCRSGGDDRIVTSSMFRMDPVAAGAALAVDDDGHALLVDHLVARSEDDLLDLDVGSEALRARRIEVRALLGALKLVLFEG
jgi:hypothetical protein